MKLWTVKEILNRKPLKESLGRYVAEHPNPALNLAPFGRWTLRDKAAQRRLALR